MDSLLILPLWIRLFCLLGNETFYLNLNFSVDIIQFSLLVISLQAEDSIMTVSLFETHILNQNGCIIGIMPIFCSSHDWTYIDSLYSRMSFINERCKKKLQWLYSILYGKILFFTVNVLYVYNSVVKSISTRLKCILLNSIMLFKPRLL